MPAVVILVNGRVLVISCSADWSANGQPGFFKDANLLGLLPLMWAVIVPSWPFLLITMPESAKVCGVVLMLYGWSRGGCLGGHLLVTRHFCSVIPLLPVDSGVDWTSGDTIVRMRFL